MNAQKERKTEYMREHFAVLRRKRGGEWIARVKGTVLLTRPPSRE